MSLKVDNCDPFLMAELFDTDLIPLEEARTESVDSALPFMGNNKKKVTVLLRDTHHTFLSDEYFPFFSKIIQSCQLNIEDIALVNVAQVPELNLSMIEEHLKPKKILLFGRALDKKLGVNLEKYKVEMTEKHFFLLADELKKLKESKEAKRDLWKGLKEMFDI